MKTYNWTYRYLLLIGLILSQFANGFAQEIQLMYSLQDLEPDTSYSQLFERANQHFDQKNYEEAIAFYNRLLAKKRSDPVVLNNRGACHALLGNYDASLKDYARALRIAPESSALYSNRGMAKSKMGKTESAIEDFRRAIQLNAKSGMSYNNLGVAYYQLNNFSAAKKCLALAMECERKSPMMHNNMGLVLSAQGKQRMALLEYEKAIKIDDEYMPAYTNRGRAYRDLGLYIEAIEDFTKGLSLSGNGDADLLCLRAELYKIQGELALALADYERALELFRESQPALLGQGEVLEQMGDLEGAKMNFLEATRLVPTSPEAFVRLGMIHAHQGHFPTALSTLHRADSLGYTHHDLYTTRGKVYLALGNREAAIADIHHAIEINPQSVSAHESLGILYLQSENFELALREFDLAAKFLNKSDREALASVLFNIAAAKANLGLFTEAMDDLDKANALCEDRKLKDAIQEFRLRLVEKGG